MEKKWYGVKTFNGYEQKVINSLSKQIEVEHMGELFGNIYLPKIKKFSFVRSKLKLKEELLFPGYVFVEMEVSNEAVFFVRGIQYVTGYAGIDSMKEIPQPMDEGEVEEMIQESEKIKIDLNVGDVIKVVNHELYFGQNLVVSNIDTVNEIITVKVDAILGDDFHEENLDFTQIEKI